MGMLRLGVQEKGGDNLSTWHSMAEEDLVLGYRDRSIVSASYVLMKINNLCWQQNCGAKIRKNHLD